MSELTKIDSLYNLQAGSIITTNLFVLIINVRVS